MDKIPVEGASMAIRGNGQFTKGQTAAGDKLLDYAKQSKKDLNTIKLDIDMIQRIKNNVGNWRVEYSDEYAAIAFEMLSRVDQCTTIQLLCAVLGCSDKTFYKWIKEHTSFAQAIAYGKAIQEAQFGNILLHGFKYARSVEYILGNLHNWSNKREDTHTIIDLNKQIAERESFAASHRVRQKINWQEPPSRDIIDVVAPS